LTGLAIKQYLTYVLVEHSHQVDVYSCREFCGFPCRLEVIKPDGVEAKRSCGRKQKKGTMDIIPVGIGKKGISNNGLRMTTF
jgi:hypothetical protein